MRCRRSARSSRLAVALALGQVALLARVARADELRIVADDGTPWSTIVDQVQDDPTSEGRAYRIQVEAGDEPARCEDYTLALDDVSAQAFRIEGCDAATGATTLRVVDRAALFEPGDVVPRARRAVVRATLVVRGQAEGGGEPPRTRSDLWCSVALVPTLWDALHGVRVPLGPDRFDIRALDGDVDVSTSGPGWEARGESRASLAFRYEVVERATDRVVLASTATLDCADTPDPLATTPAPAAITAADSAGAMFVWNIMPLTDLTWLSRSTTSIKTDDGMLLSEKVGAHRLDYYGASLGYAFRIGGWFTYAMSYTFAHGSQGQAGAWMLGMGASARRGRVTLFGAPAVRITMLSVDGVIGPDLEVDAALIGSARVKISDGGWELVAQVAAPLRDSTEWLLVGGLDHAWGM